MTMKVGAKLSDDEGNSANRDVPETEFSSQPHRHPASFADLVRLMHRYDEMRNHDITSSA